MSQTFYVEVQHTGVEEFTADDAKEALAAAASMFDPALGYKLLSVKADDESEPTAIIGCCELCKCVLLEYEDALETDDRLYCHACASASAH